MKKCLLLFISIALLSNSCAKESAVKNITPEATSSIEKVAVSDAVLGNSPTANKATKSSVIPEKASTEKLLTYLQIDLPQFNKKDQRLYYAEWGKLTGSSASDSVYIFSDKQLVKDIKTDVYMIVHIDMLHDSQSDKMLSYKLGTFEDHVLQYGILSLSDIDGDDVDEIIVHFEVTGNGRTITHVYQIENGEIILLADLSNFDTGFIYANMKDYQRGILNKYTGYSYTWDIKDQYVLEAFDENGVLTDDDGILIAESFSSCFVSIDPSDGKVVLICSQELSAIWDN